MPVHSSHITKKCLEAVDPAVMEEKFWQNTRYLIAQHSTTDQSDVTNDMYYKGKAVIPGPKANQSLVGLLAEMDLQTLKAKNSIQFVDFETTAGAAQEVTEAHYTIMSTPEADDYENILREQRKDLRVHSQTA